MEIMYSHFKEVQLMLAGLKSYGVANVVMAPGGSDIPLIHSLEEDEFFSCYSVVDERSLVYFALGLAQEMREPVACVCTSGTAVSNFLPGITEAHFQDVPLVAITADKNPRYLGQMETQKINQVGIFDPWVKCSVSLPIIQSDGDFRMSKRLINEAMFELCHRGCGPVHINIPIVGDDSLFNAKTLPEFVPYSMENAESLIRGSWKKRGDHLVGKNVLILIGQNVSLTPADRDNIEAFVLNYNCAVATESLSNVQVANSVNTYLVAEVKRGSLEKELLPDVLITIGNNYASGPMKAFLRSNGEKIEHWQISESGIPRNTYDALTAIYECSPSFFFDNFPLIHDGNSERYYSQWREIEESIALPDPPFSSLYVGRRLAETIPSGALLHLAVLNSIRVVQLQTSSRNDVTTYANVGALGIDGCLSSFLGQAAANRRRLAYCLIGDLSFFYDMNAAGMRSVSANVRIILLNNGGGSEFHYYMGKRAIPTIDRFICAENERTATAWMSSLGYTCFAARSTEEVDAALLQMSQESDAPMFLEVFTNMDEDATIVKETIRGGRQSSLKESLKDAAKDTLSPAQLGFIKKIFH